MIGRTVLSTTTAKMVFMLNFHPRMMMEKTKRIPLMVMYVYWTGIPDAQYTIEAIPGTAPEGRSLGNRNTVQPMAYINMPMAINT